MFEGAFMIFVVRSAWLSVRGHGWLTLHTHTLSVCYVTVWICWPYTCGQGWWLMLELQWCWQRKMQRTASYRHFYHSAFVYCSSQTLLNRKEINRKEVNTGIIQGIQCVSSSPSSKLLKIQPRCFSTNPHSVMTVHSICIPFNWKRSF